MDARARSAPPNRTGKATHQARNAARADADPWCKPIEELAALLSRLGLGEISPAQIRADVKAGAPRRPGGRIHIAEYAAWLLKESGGAD